MLLARGHRALHHRDARIQYQDGTGDPYVCPRRATGNIGSPRLGSTGIGASDPGDGMSKYKITVSRIEAAAHGKQDAQVRITFQVDHAPISFQVPILLRVRDFDDTEMVQAARSALHRTFVELAAQSQKWKLTAHDLQQLSKMSLRPKT